jgi:PDZ domain-containing protein
MVDDTRARPPSPRRRRRWPFVVGGAAVLVVVLLIVGFTVTLPYYTLSPGSATPVSSLITLPPGKGHPVRGSLFLTDVELQQLRLIDVIPDSFDSNVSVVSAQDLLGGTPADQYEAQSLLQMTDSKDYAEVAALRRLGYQVPEEDEGAVVVQAQPGSPASGSLHVADVIVAVDGVATPNEAALVKAIRSKQPGEVVHLVVQPGGRGLPREVPVKLGVHSVGGREVPFVGVVLETRTVFKLPFNVQVNSEGIGGPSAGLAFSLGIIDGLTTGDITGGRSVAATGTIDPEGDVGDVGGVAQKTVAVREAGATLFLVPPQEKGVAEQRAGPHMRVVAVSTLDQALAALRAAGGDLRGVPPVPQGSSGAA